MPWEVVQSGDRFCVVKKGADAGDAVGCHDTRDDALQQLKALYAGERTASGGGGGSVTAAAMVDDSVTAASIAHPADDAPAEAPPEDQPEPAPVVGEPLAAGVALVAGDTGRVLMIQRALIDGEAAGGLWEFPGGKVDGGETPWEAAQREFAEETGHELPDGVDASTWLSPNGVYRCFARVAEAEADFPMGETDAGNRAVENPDNPDGSNYTEAMAWFDPAHLRNGPKLLRPEVRLYTPWKLLMYGSNVTAAIEAEVEEFELSFVAAGQPGPRDHAVKLSTGWAYPIPDVAHLRKAVKAYGRAKPSDRAKVRAHIISRAKALGASELIPEEWKSMTASIDELDSLVASLAQPAAALLREDPLDGPTPYNVKDDGTADGHLALWASCHIGYPGCVTPPREETFDFYNLGDAVTADGRHVPIGKVTVGCGHAGPELSWRTAAAHYDDSGTTVAVSHATADRWGIRLASVLVDDASGAQIDELRRSPLSGDWRRVNGRLRLVAALGVNVPGYPVPRGLVAGGELQSMFVGFNLEDAAALVTEADSLAASIGLDPASQARAIRESLGIADAASAAS